ncbi:unnamed protein product [Polarella glacialis]|uniref:Uncharacterized protein n=1 Tax=Polarella glacialis TaxID=89957 RepID=A0A813GAG3_POLGL|nr:unnamed protein product [Polarella glacialis]
MAVGSPSEAPACSALSQELRKLLEFCDAQWRNLEDRLDQAQEATLRAKVEELEQHWGVQAADIACLTEGSFAWKVKGRVQRVMLAPLAAQMRQKVLLLGNSFVEQEMSEEAATLVLDELLDRWELEVEPLLGLASQQDERLARRARRKVKLGAAAEAAKVDLKERPALWEPAQSAVEALDGPVRRLAEFVAEKLSAEATERLAAAVPSIIARAVCDWHWRGPLAELQQLEGWWESARASLQGHVELWHRLVEEEGLFLRRIDRGVDALRSARQLYVTYADFGTSAASGGPWPDQMMQLLAAAAKEMTSRLKPVRDSAAWRVVDAAKSIQKQLREQELQSIKPGPWQGVSREEGLQAFLKAFFEAAGVGSAPGGEACGAVEAAMVFMQRAGGLSTLLGDLQAACGGPKSSVGGVLEEILRASACLSEDLLEVLDEPSVDSLFQCARQWQSLGEAGQAERLEAALAADPSPKTDVSGRQLLVLLRGLHTFLTDSELRARLPQASADIAALTGGARTTLPSQCPDSESFALPPAGTEQTHSPRGPYATRRKARFEGEPSPSKSDLEPVAAAMDSEAFAPGPLVPALKLCALGNNNDNNSSNSNNSRQWLEESTRPGTGRSLRPSTPSWLKPPWQRPDTPSACSWTRPDTPSTVCDDSEVASLPRYKFVDGQYVPLKSALASGGRTLPPLQVGSQGYPCAPLSARRSR